MRRHTVSFKHAFDGIVYMVKTQPNFRFHLLATLIVLLVASILGVTRVEFLLLLFAIMLVIVAEMLNTAVEAMTDLLTQKQSVYAKISKDVAAGMVLLTAFIAVVVGVSVFLPYILGGLS